jgi:hypothetical protein
MNGKGPGSLRGPHHFERGMPTLAGEANADLRAIEAGSAREDHLQELVSCRCVAVVDDTVALSIGEVQRAIGVVVDGHCGNRCTSGSLTLDFEPQRELELTRLALSCKLWLSHWLKSRCKAEGAHDRWN